jgi:hypothetical protein
MRKNESVSSKILGMGEPHEEPFRATLLAAIFQVVKHVSGSVGVEEVLYISLGARARGQAPEGTPITQLDGLGTVGAQFGEPLQYLLQLIKPVLETALA